MRKNARKIPLNPKHPERICWGCDKFCPASSLGCGNGSERTPHPAELFGEDWYEWALGENPEASAHISPLPRSTGVKE